MMNNRKLSIFLGRMVPSYVKDTYPEFYKFFQAYLEFIESEEVTTDGTKIKYPYRMISDLKRNFDLDQMEKEFIALQKNELSTKFPEPQSVSVARNFDNRASLKFMSKFLKSKGTEDSIKYLFKLFFDEVITIKYPNDNVLKLSSSTYEDRYLIRVNLGEIDYIDQFYQRYIISENGSTAFVNENIGNYNKITDTTGNGHHIYDLTLIDVKGKFLEGEKVFILNTTETLSFEATVTHFTPEPVRTLSSSNGLLSNSKVIGDIKTHNEFSYVISSSVPSNLWLDLVTELTHPAGFVIFAELLLFNEIQMVNIAVEEALISFVDEDGITFALFDVVRIKEFFTFGYLDANKLSNIEQAAFTISDYFRFRINDFQFRREEHLPDSLTPHSIISIALEVDPQNYTQIIR